MIDWTALAVGLAIPVMMGLGIGTVMLCIELRDRRHHRDPWTMSTCDYELWLRVRRQP